MRRMRIVSTIVVCAAAFAALVTGSLHWSGSGASASPARYVPVPGGEKGEQFAAMDSYWNDRLTYPTGRFNPAWLRNAARQDARMQAACPPAAGPRGSSWTALGPQPERMNGCTGCYNYGMTEGRINDIVGRPDDDDERLDRRLRGERRRRRLEDDELLQHVHDLDRHDRRPADLRDRDRHARRSTRTTTTRSTRAPGDLNYGSFSMGSQGILKSTDAGATWTVLGADVFGPAYDQPAGQFPQYDAVGKVRVDPNNSSKVVAGTKKGVFISYNGGVDWTGPCTTNGFTTQRQDITGLELADMGGGVTRIIAAVGTRGFATTVQYDLGLNGANGLYGANMPASGCPTFTSIASNANGFVYGNAVSGSPYATGANMNAGSGVAYANPTTGDQLGRIDIAVAPSNPNVIYAQVQSIAANTRQLRRRPRLPARRLGDRRTAARPGRSWPARQGPSLGGCGCDYPQNWYDQGVAVDPNNPDRLFVDTYDVWLATRTGLDVHRPHVRLQRPATSRPRRPARARVRQRLLEHPARRKRRRRLRDDAGRPQPAQPDQLLQHGHRPEHDRVLLGRHQRQLRHLAESVGRGRRAGQRAERRRLHGLPDRPRAVADDDRRRRLLRAHRPGRHRDRAPATSSATTAAACRAASATA